jgi:hypothetical protein
MRTITITGMLIALLVGYLVYTKSSATVSNGAPPQQTIDVIDIKTNLMNLAQAERTYLTAHGAYGTLEQLNQDAPPTYPAENRGYLFSITPNGAQSFKATATPNDPGKNGWPTLVIDETMTVSENR